MEVNLVLPPLIADHVDELAKRVLVDKETYLGLRQHGTTLPEVEYRRRSVLI